MFSGPILYQYGVSIIKTMVTVVCELIVIVGFGEIEWIVKFGVSK
jgi:hypothetical protein